MTEELVACNTFWIGKSLGPVERACLRSFLDVGHKVRLYSYDKVDGVPEKVEVREAEEILPRPLLEKYIHIDPVLAAGLIRLKILEAELGYWIDADVYCIKAHKFSDEYVFGLRDNAKRPINNAVFKIPSKSALLSALIGEFNQGDIPRWLKPTRRLKLNIRRHILGQEVSVKKDWPAATIQPLNYYIKTMKLIHLAQPKDVFYPVGRHGAHWIRDPALKLEDMITERTCSIHLWNGMISAYKNEPAPPGSFLERLQKEGS